MLILTHRSSQWDASKPTRNGIVHPRKKTQKPTEGTDLKHPTTLGEPKWHKSHTVVSSMIPMIRKTLKSQSHNLLTEELSTQLLLLN